MLDIHTSVFYSIDTARGQNTKATQKLLVSERNKTMKTYNYEEEMMNKEQKKMKKYLFKTTTTIDACDSSSFWIDKDIISDMTIEAENLNQALKGYQKKAYEKSDVDITDDALEMKDAMYSEDADGITMQTGYVITGSTEIQDDESGRYTEHNVELWVKIQEVNTPLEFIR